MLKKHIKLVVLIVSLCSILAACFLIPKFWTNPKTAQESLNNGDTVGFDEAEGVTMTIPGSTQNAYWELNIHKIKTTTGDINNLEQVEGVYFVNKIPSYQISGNRGTVYLKTRRLEIIGNVILKAMDGSKKITAERVVWDTLGNKVTAQKNAILETLQTIVTTEEIVADLGIDHAVFNGQTKVSYQRTNE